MNDEENQKINKSDKPDRSERLDDLEKRLYKKDNFDSSDLSSGDYHQFENNEKKFVKGFWPSYKTPKGRTVTSSISSNLKMKFLKQILSLSVVIFLVAVGVFLYVLFGNKNTISAKNISIDIVAPSEVAGGQEVDLYINIENQNNTVILDSDLIIDFPTGTVITDELGNPVKRWRERLGDIAIGGKLTKKYTPIFFGEEGETKSAKISLEYRVAGSNALVSKDVYYDFLVKSTPVSVTVSGPAEVAPGSEATYDIVVKSQNQTTIKDIAVMINYSFGFEPQSFAPQPTFGVDYWQLGDLNPESERKISVTGKFSGFEGDQKIFVVMVGSGGGASNSLETLFLEKQIAINLTKPFLATSFVVNGSYAEEPIVAPGGEVRVDLIVKNNLSENLEDVEIKARIYGGLHSESSISVPEGFYRSLDQVLLWNQKTMTDLQTLPAGSSQRLGFSFKLRDDVDYGSNKNFTIEATISGLKSRSGFGLERVSFSDQLAIKLSSSMQMVAEGFYNQEPFTGVGFIPPKVENETYYTIHFRAGGSSNDLTGVVMRANLPVYVKWQGDFVPFGASLKYSPVDNNIVWEAGDIKAGEEKEVYFRVLLVPSLSQVGREAVLVRSISGQGIDVFSGRKQVFESRDITTKVIDVTKEEAVVSK